MEKTEWIHYTLSSFEHEGADSTLWVEVRIYEQDGMLYAEPIYYKLLDKRDNVLMDNAFAGRQGDRLWKFCEWLIAEEYNERILTWFELEDPTFEPLRRERQIERAMDNEWYRRNVL